MRAYRYEALDADGRKVSGIVEADTPRHARGRLRAKGLLPATVDPVEARAGLSSRASTGIAPSELTFLTGQLALLIESGLTIEQALATQIDASAAQRTRETLAGVKADLASGLPLSAALGRQERSFPEYYRALIRAAEEAGALAQVLGHLARYLEARQLLRQNVGLALLYPAMVTAVAIAIVLGLMTYVVPQVVQVFAQSRQSLPLLTRLLIAFSDFMLIAWPWLLAGTAGAITLARFALRRESVKLRWHALVLRLPGIGDLVRSDNSARLAGTLGILVEGGVPPFAALNSGMQVMGNLAMRQKLAGVIAHVREGVGLARALALSEAFPPLLVHLAASGEASGKLAQMLARAAVLETAMLERRLAMIMTAFGPLLILAMGGAVLAIVLAILLPIVEINQLVR